MVLSREFQSDHRNEIFEQLNRDRKEDDVYRDVTINDGTKKHSAHKNILGLFCVFFGTMFTTEMREKYNPDVSIQGISSEIMELILDFVYTAKILITEQNVFEILEAADYLQINRLQKFCETFLQTMVGVKNCVTILAYSQRFNLENLKETAQKFIAENLEVISSKQEFLKLCFDDLLSILNLKEKGVSSEKIVYNAMINWIKHDSNERQKHFNQLFQSLDLLKFDQEFLRQVVMKEELVMKSLECNQILISAIVNLIPSNKGPTKLLIMGGISLAKDVVLFDTVTKQWKQMNELNEGRHGASSAVVNKQVFIMGGEKSSSVESLRIDDANPRWQIQPPMKQVRQKASSAVLNGCIYTTGGMDEKGENLKSGEFLNVRTNERGNIPDMIKPRDDHVLLAAGGKLFAIGGFGGNRRLNSSECFDFDEQKWSLISPMKYGVCKHAAVVLDDHIFVTGGSINNDTVSSVMKYNISTDTWMDAPPMNKDRRYHCASVVDGNIYVVGGWGYFGSVNSIEVFDPTNNKWEIIAETRRTIIDATMVVV